LAQEVNRLQKIVAKDVQVTDCTIYVGQLQCDGVSEKDSILDS
jgi:hypothetical protein